MALILLLASLFGALGLGLTLNLSTEQMLGRNASEASGLRQAAESALEVALHELGPAAAWDDALAGARTARFSDGPPFGPRLMAGGETVDLELATDFATCDASPCHDPDIIRSTETRPWGTANPRWRLFAWGTASTLADAAWLGDPYLLVWVADDPADADGDPWRDAPLGVDGHGAVMMRSQALGRRGARATIEALVRDRCAGGAPGPCIPGSRVQSWRIVD